MNNPTTNNTRQADKLQEEALCSDYDGAWKAALEKYFKEFMELLFPAIHKQIDWNKGYEFLDGELEKITVDAKTGRRFTDKLAKVYYLDGTEEWLLIHLEVQASTEPKDTFPQRMFTYWSRLRDRYQVDVVSLAVLADTHAAYRPNHYRFSRSGTEMSFTYPLVKLIDFESKEKWESLEKSKNLFALLVMAQIKAQRLKNNTEELFKFRFGLTRSLYYRGLNREQIIEFFNFIGWLIRLPESLEEKFINAIKSVEEKLKMPYINTVERYGIKQGMLKGLEQGLEQGRIATARNMLLRTELDDATIAAVTELKLQEVEALRKSLSSLN